VFACSLVSASATRAAVIRCSSCAVGQTLSWHGTSYRVSKVRTAARIGDGQLGAPAQGIFIILTITMTNFGTAPSTVIADALQIRTRTDDVYATSDKAFGVYSNAFQPLERLRPRVPTTVTAVYDLPKNAVHGARLEIRDIGTGTRAAIALGL
jgi:Domain of unknown function (DUF4352)